MKCRISTQVNNEDLPRTTVTNGAEKHFFLIIAALFKMLIAPPKISPNFLSNPLMTPCIRNAVIKSPRVHHWMHQIFPFLLSGLAFPVETVPLFISQSLWYQTCSVAPMTSLGSSPPISLRIKEPHVWSSDNSAEPSYQSQTLCPTQSPNPNSSFLYCTAP